MPTRPPHQCAVPGCPGLTSKRYCQQHKGGPSQDRKASPSVRGYGRRWQRVRERYLREHPLCVMCLEQRILAPASQVDHVVAVSGPDDPRFWQESNWNALCGPHHSAKTVLEDGGFGLPKRNVKHE